MLQTIPATLEHLGREFVTHSSDHHDLGIFAGRELVVFDARASAIDTAALLDEAGATVQLVARKPVVQFHSGVDLIGQWSLWKKLLSSNQRDRAWIACPFLLRGSSPFHLFPEGLRLHVVQRTLGLAGGWFMKQRFAGKISTALGFVPEAAHIENNQVHLNLRGADGSVSEAAGRSMSLERLAINLILAQ